MPTGGRGISQQGTILEAGTGAVLRTIESKLRDTISIADFGADPTGVADSSSAIQAAINSVATDDLPNVGNRIFFPAGIYKIGTALTVPASTQGYNLEGAGGRATVLKYTGSGVALTVGTTAADTQGIRIAHMNFELGSASSGAGAVQYRRVTFGSMEDILVTGRTSAPDLGTAIFIDGTGSASYNVLLDNVEITGNYTKGIYSQGTGVTNTSNNHCFKHVVIARTTLKPGTGTIAFHWGSTSGDGAFQSIDVEGYDVGYQIDGGYLRGNARAENNTLAVAFGAASFDNWISLAPFNNTSLVTYAVGQAYNSLFLPDGLEMNLNTGVVSSYLMLRDRTDHSSALRFQAGLTAEQDEAIEWYDRTANKLFQMRKASYGALVIEDIASGGIPRLSISGGTNDDTVFASAGTGAVTVNTVAGRGTGGFKVGDGAGNTTTVISSAGKVTTYNGIATVGYGHPTIHGALVALTGQTANLGATSVYASAPAGVYRVTVTALTTTSGTGTTANLNVLWTDEGGAKTDAVGTWALNSVTSTGQINKTEIIRVAASTNIQVSVTAGTYGTSAYAIYAQVERLQ